MLQVIEKTFTHDKLESWINMDWRWGKSDNYYYSNYQILERVNDRVCMTTWLPRIICFKWGKLDISTLGYSFIILSLATIVWTWGNEDSIRLFPVLLHGISRRILFHNVLSTEVKSSTFDKERDFFVGQYILFESIIARKQLANSIESNE